MSANTNAGIALALTVALLTGLKAHPPPARRHGAPAGGRVRALPRADPERIVVGDANISAPVRPVNGRASDGISAQPRTRAQTAGWYRTGPSPGEAGTAVIVGHFDSASGSAAFHWLDKVGTGDHVKVIRRDHQVAWFKVDSVRRAATVPIRRTDRPELRLITCCGRFDQTRERYADNLVVSAHLVRTSPERTDAAGRASPSGGGAGPPRDGGAGP